jgi:hypothetical protein
MASPLPVINTNTENTTAARTASTKTRELRKPIDSPNYAETAMYCTQRWIFGKKQGLE